MLHRGDDGARVQEGVRHVDGPRQQAPAVPAQVQHHGAHARVEHLLQRPAQLGGRHAAEAAQVDHADLAAHQLVQHAEALGKNQSALAESLMTAFFAEGRDIGQRDVLLELGDLYGIPPEETRSALASGVP